MDVVTITGPINFRLLVEALDVASYSEFGDGTSRKYVDLPSLGLYGTVFVSPFGSTVFQIYAEAGNIVSSIVADRQLDLTLPHIGLTQALYEPNENAFGNINGIYSVQDKDAHLQAYATDDTIVVNEGRVNAGNGDDRIIVLDNDVTNGPNGEAPEIGSGNKAIVKGGEGEDTFFIQHLNVNVSAGDDNDLITVGWGTVYAHGGAGNDTFLVNTSQADFIGLPVEEDIDAFFFVRDFGRGDDIFVFETTSLDTSGLTDRSFDEIFDGATLADLDPSVDIDGLTYTFAESGNGEATITRSGTTNDGASIDETIRFKGDGLADIALSDMRVTYVELDFGF